jgi:hypothetical protein
MCLHYTITYACRCSEGVTTTTPNCKGNCKGKQIKYDETKDYDLLDNCLKHELSKADSSIDSSVLDHTLEDP